MATQLTKDNVHIKIGDGAGEEVFTEIPNVLTINLGPKAWDFKDKTYINAPSLAKRSVPTLYENSEIKFTIDFNASEATHALLLTNEDGQAHNFQRKIDGV